MNWQNNKLVCRKRCLINTYTRELLDMYSIWLRDYERSAVAYVTKLRDCSTVSVEKYKSDFCIAISRICLYFCLFYLERKHGGWGREGFFGISFWLFAVGDGLDQAYDYEFWEDFYSWSTYAVNKFTKMKKYLCYYLHLYIFAGEGFTKLCIRQHKNDISFSFSLLKFPAQKLS